MNMIQQASETLRKIQNERTHCQCSREKEYAKKEAEYKKAHKVR